MPFSLFILPFFALLFFHSLCHPLFAKAVAFSAFGGVQSGRDGKRAGEKERPKKRERERERQTDRQIEREERERERERERETAALKVGLYYSQIVRNQKWHYTFYHYFTCNIL